MDHSSCKKIFVYGTLRQGFNSPAYQYISQYFSMLGMAHAKAYLYDLGDYPAAKPTEDEAQLIGELYTIVNEDEFDWAIAQLDDYEGINPSFDDEASQYERSLVEVTLANNEKHMAWTYWFTGATDGLPTVPSGDVWQYHIAKQNRH